MATIQAQVIAPVTISAAPTVVYTGPNLTTTRISRACFSNPSGAPIAITVYLVPTGGTAGANNQIINAVNVPASGTPGSNYSSPEMAGLVIPAGYTLQAFASTPGVIVLYASGTRTS